MGAAGLVVIILIAACGPVAPADRPLTPTTAADTPRPSPTVAPATPTMTGTPPAAATATPPPSPTSARTATPTRARATAVPTATTTPAPTFTPPPLPPSLAGEHLWLRRPVADDPMWTDKSYPYGSTRGGALRPHTGVEFGVATGTPVLAAAGGTVVAAGDDSQIAYGPQTNFYGNLVIVQTMSEDGSSIYTLYGHLSEVHVAVSQTVAAGDVLGLSGASGVADGPHLHFEVRAGANSYEATRNPLLWLLPLPSTGIVAGRIIGPGGELLAEAPITLERVDAPAPYTATTSYALGEPNADGALGENFAVDDVVPGFYEAVVDTGRHRYTAEVWVYPGRVNWVEIVVGG